MEEIKVGDFCRNKEGKIIEVGWVGSAVVIDIYDDVTFSKLSGEIVKHSSDIKDLVQAGDIVTYKLYKHSKFYNTALVKEYQYTENGNIYKEYLGVNGFDIKSENVIIKEILTKEQFDSRKYIVGGKSNVES